LWQERERKGAREGENGNEMTGNGRRACEREKSALEILYDADALYKSTIDLLEGIEGNGRGEKSKGGLALPHKILICD